MSDKPREYWIFPGVEAWQTDEVVMNPKCVKPYHIHVIEYSAYESLLAQRFAYASEFDGDQGSIHENIRKLKKERDEARAELEVEHAKSQKLLVTLKRALAWARDKHELPHYSEMLYDAEQSIAEYAKESKE